MDIAKKIRNCKGTIFIFGNGGSLAEASHFAEELVPLGISAIALNDPNVITAIANDFSFEEIFIRQIMAHGKKGDIAIGISSSGKSMNVNLALDYAHQNDLVAIDFPRKGKTTEEVQNNQLKLIHEIYCDLKPNEDPLTLY